MISSLSYGKIILFGEHAVVYGEPGIAVPVKELSTIISVEKSNSLKYTTEIDLTTSQKKLLLELIKFITSELKITQNMNINIDSSIPLSSGFGSSASLSVAMIKAVSELNNINLTNEQICKLSYECEKIFHGSPSGIDNTVITYERPIYFQNKKFGFINIKKPFKVYMADSKLRASTKDVVVAVKNNFENKKHIIPQIGEIVKHARVEMEKGNLKELGNLMTRNHELLKELGVSCKELDDIVEVALKAGAYGAKLSGKGKGGSVIILADEHIKLPFETDVVVIA